MTNSFLAETSVEEIVYPRILEARGANGEKMLHIRDGLTLSLEKSTVFSENFTFTKGDDVNYSNSSLNVKEIEDNLYQDREHGSSVVLQESNGYLQVSGILTYALSIEPVLSNPRSKEGIVAHLISKFNDTSIPMYDDAVNYTNLAERRFGGNIHRVARRRRRNLPPTVTIETRIVYDDALHKLKGKYLTRYLAILMSTVNLLYSTLKNPRPRFVIVGIDKLKSEAYLKLSPGRRLKVCSSINPLNYYVSRSWRSGAHDVVAFVSGFDWGPRQTVGCTFICGVCSYQKVTVQSLRGLSQGTAALLIAHELGHQLGMEHEGDRASYFTPGNAGLYCGPSAGFVMTPVLNMPGRSVFSYCVYDQMKGCLM
ncbi:snake venom metalloproteinase ACLF-like [Ixodes scapularis]|uniref:snake venom metalloproteinase ACLF-like n=1 Tax=Ixodes scapularis TaxID=6945 RepID=UPI001A9E6D88|nr:snake venom metalloproteinase ACLF-like [Ixodes scapularis]